MAYHDDIEEEIITATFNPKQSKKLAKHQKDPDTVKYTCKPNSDIRQCEQRSDKSNGELIITNGIWVCPCGKYKQYWAYKKDVK